MGNNNSELENVDSVAFISRVMSINPIEGADKIEQAICEGWSSVVQKGIHKEGDLVLCITNDAVIDEFDATRWGISEYLRKGNRVRTIKLKGVYSECILIPLSDIENYLHTPDYVLGKDMQDILGIFKYQPPIIEDKLPNGQKVIRNNNFPIFYKFPNQKNVKNMFTENDLCVMTRKVHGTNARYGIVKKSETTLFEKIKRFLGISNKWDDYEYVYGSHNVQKYEDSNSGYYNNNYWKEISDTYGMKDKLWKFFKANDCKQLIVYGEIIGPGIQGKDYDYGLKEHKFLGFNIVIDDKYLDQSYTEVAFKSLGLEMVDILYKGNYDQDILNRQINKSFITLEGKSVTHEGVVIACPTGDRFKVCKVINQDYLIYSEKHHVPDSH